MIGDKGEGVNERLVEAVAAEHGGRIEWLWAHYGAEIGLLMDAARKAAADPLPSPPRV